MISSSGRITLRRSGSFSFETSGPACCGTESPLTLEYLVEVECGIKLDDRGFLFDQLPIHEYFRNIRHATESCELLALRCARDIHSMILENHSGCQIKDFKLSLKSPVGAAAFVTFHFNEERDTLPCPPPSR